MRGQQGEECITPLAGPGRAKPCLGQLWGRPNGQVNCPWERDIASVAERRLEGGGVEGGGQALRSLGCRHTEGRLGIHPLLPPARLFPTSRSRSPQPPAARPPAGPTGVAARDTGGGLHAEVRGERLRQLVLSHPSDPGWRWPRPPLGRNYGGPGRGRRAHSRRIPPPPSRHPRGERFLPHPAQPLPGLVQRRGGGTPLCNSERTESGGSLSEELPEESRGPDRRGIPTSWALSL
ncbi:uncharacterized protein LOC124971576 [Sciurus carolinensis]|uniref:uncharacterized protein LOC124971576 n=1 Tax=Sciurus carolinensis TaxID=30640 RepID=UPI001FB2ECAB|nr:uncharacterized protein LOC124971576 [Sciurus carolinensis]